MSYNQNITSNSEYGVLKIGTGLSVTDGVVSCDVTQGATGPIGATGLQGATGSAIGSLDLGYFYSSATQTNASSINTVTLSNTTLSQGITLVSGSRITVSKSANYNLSIMIQFTKSSSAGNSAIGYFWLRKNGVDVADSASDVTTSENNSGVVASWSYALPLVASDYLEMVWSSSLSNAILIARPAQVGPPIIPRNPSVRMTLFTL